MDSDNCKYHTDRKYPCLLNSIDGETFHTVYTDFLLNCSPFKDVQIEKVSTFDYNLMESSGYRHLRNFNLVKITRKINQYSVLFSDLINDPDQFYQYFKYIFVFIEFVLQTTNKFPSLLTMQTLLYDGINVVSTHSFQFDLSIPQMNMSLRNLIIKGFENLHKRYTTKLDKSKKRHYFRHECLFPRRSGALQQKIFNNSIQHHKLICREENIWDISWTIEVIQLLFQTRSDLMDGPLNFVKNIPTILANNDVCQRD